MGFKSLAKTQPFSYHTIYPNFKTTRSFEVSSPKAFKDNNHEVVGVGV